MPVGALRGWPCLAAVVAVCGGLICGAGAVLAAGPIAACCFIAGHAVRLAAGVRGRVDPVLCSVVGLGVVVLLLVAVGLSQVPMLPAFWSGPACRPHFCCRGDCAGHAVKFCGPGTPADSWGLPRAGCAWLILFALLFFLFGPGRVAERLWDALAMHLLIPSQVRCSAHLGYYPNQFAFAFFPLGADYLFAFAYALGGEAAAKLINVLALVAMLLLLADIVRSCCPPAYAELGVLCCSACR